MSLKSWDQNGTAGVAMLTSEEILSGLELEGIPVISSPPDSFADMTRVLMDRANNFVSLV